MKLMPMLTVAALAIAVVAAFFAIWPAVADAPWEDDTPAQDGGTTDAIRCEGALSFRESIIETGAYSISLQRGMPDPNPDGVRDYDAQLAKAEREIDRYCRDRCDVFSDALRSASSMDAILDIHDEMRDAGCG